MLNGKVIKENFISQDIVIYVKSSMGARCLVESYIVFDINKMKNYNKIIFCMQTFKKFLLLDF